MNINETLARALIQLDSWT